MGLFLLFYRSERGLGGICLYRGLHAELGSLQGFFIELRGLGVMMIGLGRDGRRLDPETISVVNISRVDSQTGRNHVRG